MDYQFCGTCGVSLFLHIRGPESDESVSETALKKINLTRKIRPTNLRALDFFLGLTEVDVEERKRIEPKVVRVRNGGDRGAWTYVVPE
jgi:hypothetical protein